MKFFLTYFGLLLFLLPLLSLRAQGQEERPLVPYSRDYKFKDGLYLNIDAVRWNNPIPLGRIVTDLNTYNRDFFDELIIREEIILYDESGVRASIRTSDIWGYARNGRLYIMLGGKFQRIIIEGSISHFIASATTMERPGLQPDDTAMYYSSTRDLYRTNNRKPNYRYVTAQGKASLFDFESNTLTAYNPEALGKLLERDSVLSSEYRSLRKRERPKRMIEFIHRYNARHPLYFPAD
jgi:hypothetical protein